MQLRQLVRGGAGSQALRNRHRQQRAGGPSRDHRGPANMRRDLRRGHRRGQRLRGRWSRGAFPLQRFFDLLEQVLRNRRAAVLGIRTQERSVESGGVAEIAELAVALGDVEEQRRRGLRLVGGFEQLPRVGEMPQLVLPLAFLVERARQLDSGIGLCHSTARPRQGGGCDQDRGQAAARHRIPRNAPDANTRGRPARKAILSRRGGCGR